MGRVLLAGCVVLGAALVFGSPRGESGAAASWTRAGGAHRSVAGPAAPGDTANFVTPDPRPRAAYGTFPAACDTAEALLRRVLGAYADSASFSRESTPFVYHDKVYLAHTVHGRPYWSMGRRDTAVIVSAMRMTLRTWTDDPSSDTILEALAREEWLEDLHYTADGIGRQFALVSREALCVFHFSWNESENDPGDDPEDAPEDSAYVRAPGMQVELVCVPRPPVHPLQRSRED